MNENHIVIECPLCGERGLHVMGTKASEETRQCLNCGYVTAPKFKCEKIEDNTEYNNLTPDMKQWAKHEEGYIWIPTIMTLPFGILYPFNDDKEMKWGFAEMVNIPEDEQKNYPIENSEGFYTQRYDMENSKTFDSFLLGMNYVNDTVKQKQAKSSVDLPKLELDDE